MEIIWSLLLTACFTDTNCKYQDVQWFESKEECIDMKTLHEEIPIDGDWKSVEYVCKPVGSKEV
tara:strand:+ start:1503 stop:1694 length:192 start_codon:yes stop_codon:yes gene_type:complete